MTALLSLEEAADFFGCHPDIVRLWAAAGIIRGAKVGRAWRFKQADLDSHFDALCGGVCRSTKGKASGGSICGAAEDELDAVLERQAERLRRDSTTNLKLDSGKSAEQAGPLRTPSSRGSKNEPEGAAT
jgi:excisionase family DNA binding protein